MLVIMAETSGLRQGTFRSIAMLENKPRSNAAKYDLQCCKFCVFTKYYCFDIVLEDMFLL